MSKANFKRLKEQGCRDIVDQKTVYNVSLTEKSIK
jgi:hypothetical protein